MRSLIIKIIQSVIWGGCFINVAMAHQTPLLDSHLLLPMLFAVLCLFIAVFSIYRLKRSEKNLQQSEVRFKNSILASGDALWEWHIDSNQLERINDGLFQDIKQGKQTPPNLGNIHPKDQANVKLALNQHLAGETSYFEASYRTKDIYGKWRWVLDRGKVIQTDSDLKPTRMTGTLKDISSIKSTQDRLSLLANCIENLSDAIAIYDNKFTLIEVNKQYLTTFGGNAAHYIGKTFDLPGQNAQSIERLKSVLLKRQHYKKEIKLVNNAKQTAFFDLSIDTIKNAENNVDHYIVVFSDITARKQTELQLQKLSNRDRLTGLPNRNQFFSDLKKLAENKNHHALLVFDLDNFKKINDSLGHQAGDILLCRLANRVNKLARQQDHFYRLGGDEFALVISGTNDIHTITDAAKTFLHHIEKPFHMSGHELVVTSSIGIVLFPEDGSNPEVLLKNADTAMYHAKQHGNRYLFFNDAMNRQAVKRLQIENLIRFGLKEDHFSVFYQPKMNINTGKLVGMEALVRFITPNKGMISPAQFIPIAEETGQIVDIGEIVLDKACQDVKNWLERGLFDGRVAVNLSAKQFMLPDLTAQIDKLLQKHELPSYFLELEITEGTVMDDPQDAIKIMKSLSARGIHLAIDDFGTGYSSLAYLKQFPLNTLKVDKAFVDDMCNDKGKNMVDSIVTIAHNLGLSVVAEGVEEKEQVDQLKRLKCETVQGYFYSKPLSQAQFEDFLIEQQQPSQQQERKLSLVANQDLYLNL